MASDGGSVSVGSPLLIVVLVVMLGATIYLRHKRFIRRKTSYLMLVILLLALLYAGVSLYNSGA
jgi:hypothetical protein